MNKIYLFTAAFAVMASLSGCSDTELASIDTAQEKTPIGFHTVGSQMGSRAEIINSSNDLKSFNVYAFKKKNDDTDGDLFMGNNDDKQGYKGVNISYKGGKWNYTTSAELKYWPTDALNFYAVSPGGDQILYTWQISDSKKEIHVSTVNEYGDPENNPENVDVMYAIKLNQNKSSNGGTVKMNFRHILSQVAFKARTETPKMEVTIEGIEIYNFHSIGYFTLPNTDVQPTTLNNWKYPNEGYTTKGWTAVKGKSIDVGDTETPISMDKPMLFIPQKLNKWTTTAESPKTTDQAKANKESYLKISCKIKLDGSYMVGSDDAYDNLYVPFGADWQPGKRYIYTLVFGGGYDVNGNSILTPINFTADTEAWLEKSSNLVTE